VQGGRIVADWPGLKGSNLQDGRDLKPTLALDALISSACAQTFQLDPDRTAKMLFPGIGQPQAMQRLLRT
jgi:uncharacterized protein (DUF1501 family)